MAYALHSIIIKKPISLDEAKALAKPYMKKKKFFRDLKTAYHFRHIAKSYFIPKTFKTEKISKQVVLVMGELKPQYQHMGGLGLEGAGFLDKLKAIVKAPMKLIAHIKHSFTPAKQYNNISTKTLNAFKDGRVTEITLYRTPIVKALENVLNAISLGKFEKEKSKFDIDKLFHLAMVVKINLNGKENTVVVEKNATINISEKYSKGANTEILSVPFTKKELSFGEFMSNAEASEPKNTYFEYNPFDNNCQAFLKVILSANKLYNPTINKWLFQDVKQFNVTNNTKNIAKAITDLGGIVSRLLGEGKQVSFAKT